MKRTTIALSILMAASAGHLAAADFLPLAPGNNWTYRDAVTGDSINIRVGTQVYANEHTYHTLHGYAGKQLYVRTNDYGNLVYWDEEAGTEPILISFEPFQSGWWDANLRQCPTMGQTQEKRTAHAGPGGRWSNVLDIRYRTYGCADAGEISEQFAENIGMLQRVVSTIAGPRTYDLVYARVGTQTISPARTGNFSVAATDGAEPGTWQATLRIELPGTVRLQFLSGQEFDARLRDSSGRIVWVWSADKLFVQALHDLRINGVWTANIVIPHPPSIPEAPQTYTLEAWMTPNEGEPRFAAVTTVVIPGRP